MILEPRHLWRMAREAELPNMKEFSRRLVAEHALRRVNTSNSVMIPEYWSEVVFNGVIDLVSIDPEIKFGNITEYKNKLRIFTIPVNEGIRNVLYDIYNEIDTLIADTIVSLMSDGKGAMFK